MPSSDTIRKIERSRQATELLRHPTMHAACEELNQQAFTMFVNATDEPARQMAREMVNGGDWLLAILRGWAADIRFAEEEAESR